MKTRRTIKGTSAGGLVEEAYTPSNPPSYATNATNIIPDSIGAVNPLGRKGGGTVGAQSTALGNNSIASADSSIALGRDSTASANSSIALGATANASSMRSMAMGYGSKASDTYAIALGDGSKASNTSSTAIGDDASAGGIYSTALGYDASAVGASSTALGRGASAVGSVAIALGWSSVNGDYSIAMGFNAKANGSESIALGRNAYVDEAESKVIQLGGSTLSTLRCRVNLTVTSDERDKTDISDITDALAFLEKLNPVTFVSNDRVNYISDEDKRGENYRKYGMCKYDRIAHAAGTKKGERRRCGLLAQEVIAAMQEVYGTDNYANVVNDNFHDLTEKPSDVENKYTLAYANLVPFLIGAIKELNAKIKELEGK